MYKKAELKEEKIAVALAAFLKVTSAYRHSAGDSILLEKRWERIIECEREFPLLSITRLACAISDALTGDLRPADPPTDPTA